MRHAEKLNFRVVRLLVFVTAVRGDLCVSQLIETMQEAGHPFGLYNHPHSFKKLRSGEVSNCVWFVGLGSPPCMVRKASEAETEAPSPAHGGCEVSP